MTMKTLELLCLFLLLISTVRCNKGCACECGCRPHIRVKMAAKPAISHTETAESTTTNIMPSKTATTPSTTTTPPTTPPPTTPPPTTTPPPVTGSCAALIGSGSGLAMNVHWTFREAKDEIDFVFEAETSGDMYVAMGFNTISGMDNGDIIAVIRRADGSFKMSDRKAPSTKGAPVIDASQDITNQAVTKVGNIVTASFTRKRDTGDSNDFVISDSLYLIFAVGDTFDYDANTIGYHSARGVSGLNCLGFSQPE